MRTHIAKQIQTRCAAIENAVKVYNRAAAALPTPRPPLDWKTVTHYSFLDEFLLLRDTRQDVRQHRWTEPAVRATMKQALRITRAREEIERCNIEVRRLHTAIADEEEFFTLTLSRLQSEHSPNIGSTAEYIGHRRLVNMHLLHRIIDIYQLPGFTGITSLGVRKGSTHIRTSTTLLPTQPSSSDSRNAEDWEDEAAINDITANDIGALLEYIDELPTKA